MAIKCVHTDHSSTNQPQKSQKVQPEEAEGSTTHEGKTKPLDTYGLLHLKHDWFDKGDTVVVHLYVKEVTKQDLSIILYEDELQVNFSTSNKEFLKMYSCTSASTLFSWNLKLRGKVDITSSSSRVAKAFLEISLKKKSPGRWNGLEKPNIPGHEGGSISGDRPFRHLCHGTSSNQESPSKGTMCNGMHNNTEESKYCGGQDTTNNNLIKAAPNANVTEETVTSIPEEKVIPDGDPVVTQVCKSSLSCAVDNSCDDCGAVNEKESPEMCESERLIESKLDSNFGSELRTKDSGESTDRHFNLETSTDRTPVGNSSCNITACSQSQKATTTSTAKSLTTTFSSLSTNVQPSTSTSTMSSVPSFDSTKASVSERAIPLPPPIPPPPPQLSSVRGCGDGQVKTGVMGGSQSDTTHLPFSEAIRAAASKSMSVGKESFDSFDNYGECAHLGLTGLENLGNTCYLNSIVQCLANTRQLRDFFLADKYKDDINTKNPLGTGGKLAVIFAYLMRNLWSGREGSLSPYKLKGIVGEKVCQFKGFMQQDAQEFMAFLLDGLHEDLNRIKKKPYVEEVEGAGRPDAEVANEAWRRYKSRNDSVIVDLFQGQLKSKLTCPVCNKISIKYDPFMNLSVPLPKEQKLLPVIIFFKDYKRVPLKIVVKVTQDASVEQLTAAVQRVTAIHPENMRVHEIFRGKFHRTFNRGSSLSSVVSTDIMVVYEVLSEEEAGEDVYEVPIIQRTVCPRVIPSHCASCYNRPGPGVVLRRCTQCWGIGYCNQDCQKDHWSTHKRSCKRVPQPIGAPFIVSIPASQATFSQLQTVAEGYSKYSVVVRPGVSGDQDSPKKGETSSVSAEGAGAAGSAKDSSPKFHIKPVTSYGDGITGQEGTRLSAEGPEPLNLEGKHFSIDWKNHPRSTEFVVVEDKDLECEEHSSFKSETISESYSCSLKECLELFTEPETLSENDAWYCPECKAHREATKQLSVWRLPEVLIIHLKRFSFRNILFKDKITKLVEFPLRGLDMSRFTLGKDDKEGSLYDLFAVANHSGTVNFGHYTAFGRLAEKDHPFHGLKNDGLGWRYFDDRNVTEMSEERVVSKYAYVLFYKRRHTFDSLQTDAEPVAAQEEMENVEERAKASLEDVDENELD